MNKGKDLFLTKNVRLKNDRDFKLEFSFAGLMELEDYKDDFQAVFDMFEKDFTTKNMMLALWGCLLAHHSEEFENIPKEQIHKEMAKLLEPKHYMLVKLATLEVFSAFWNEAQNKAALPSEYQAVIDEFNKKGSKKK